MKVNRSIWYILGIIVLLGGVIFFAGFTNGHKTWRYRSAYDTFPWGSKQSLRIASLTPVSVPYVDSSGSAHDGWAYFVTYRDKNTGRVNVGYLAALTRAIGTYDPIYMIAGAKNLSNDRLGVWYFRNNSSTLYYASFKVPSTAMSEGAVVMRALASAPAVAVSNISTDESFVQNIRAVSAVPVGNDLFVWIKYYASDIGTPGDYELLDYIPGGAANPPATDAPAYSLVAGVHDVSWYVSNGRAYVLYLRGPTLYEDVFDLSSHDRISERTVGVDSPVVVGGFVLSNGNPVGAAFMEDKNSTIDIYYWPESADAPTFVGRIQGWTLRPYSRGYSTEGAAYLVSTYTDSSDNNGVVIVRVTPNPSDWDFGNFGEADPSMRFAFFYPVLDAGGVVGAWQTAIFKQYNLDVIHYAHIAIDTPYSVYDLNGMDFASWTPDNNVHFVLHVRGAAVGAPAVTQYFVVSIWDANYHHNWRYIVPVTFPDSNSLVSKDVPVSVTLSANNTFFSDGSPVEYNTQYRFEVYTLDNVPTAYEYMHGNHSYYATDWEYPYQFASAPPQPSAPPELNQPKSHPIDISEYEAVLSQRKGGALSVAGLSTSSALGILFVLALLAWLVLR